MNIEMISKIKNNIHLVAQPCISDSGTSWDVSINGLDGRLDAKSHCDDRAQMMAFIGKAMEQLDCEVTALEVFAVNRGFAEAQQRLAEAQSSMDETVKGALAIFNAQQEDAATSEEVSVEQKPAAPKEQLLDFSGDNAVVDAPKDAAGDSPMVRQFKDLKKKHPDALLLFRCGDFYETYFDDAEVCSKVLGITLTRRSSDKEKTPMAGFPYHALDTYLPKLIRAGHRVAICDQTDNQSTVKRGRKPKAQ